MPDKSPKTLVEKAKVHLGLPPSTRDASVPWFYIDELRRHLSLYPHEDNFRVTLQPKVGFGSVTCLKDGCNAIIPLFRGKRARGDGGKTNGLGSLSAYRDHLAVHTEKQVIARVKAEPSNRMITRQASSSTISVKTESTPSSSPPPALSTSTSSDRENTFQRQVGPFRVKSEMAELPMPRKRPAESAFVMDRHEVEDNVSRVVHKPTKKARTEVPKAPLSSVTNNPTASSSTSASREENMSSADLAPTPYEMLGGILLAIEGQHHILDKIRIKQFKTAQDLQMLATADSELRRLRTLEQEYYRVAKSVSSSNPFVQRPTIVKTEAIQHEKIPSLTRNANLAIDRKPSIAQPFPMALDVEHKPVVPLVHRRPASFPSSSPEPSNASSQTSSPPRNVRERSPLTQFNNAIASSSKGPQKESANAQASGSNHPTFPILPPSDDEYSDEDSYEYNNLPDTSALVNLMGIKLPAPIMDDAQDRNGDYYGRGRDLFVGPQAAHDDLEKFLIQLGNAESFDGNASVDKALEKLGLKSLNDPIPGMEVTLMAHQAIGVAWMMEKERSVLKGGCLADEMGLGKTVQMIACMTTNRSTDPKCKTTLIVAPLALLDQWKSEIEMKTNSGLSCLIYHGASRTKSKAELMRHDIVLTTFNTMAREWPDYEAEMKKKAKAKKKGDDFIVSEDDEDMKDITYRTKKRKQRAGLLFQVKFFRVVLDEAQNIRNRRTRISRSITDMQSERFWCLTGTPIVNSLVDVYGYIRFLKIRPWYDWSEFQKHIGIHEKKKPDLAVTRLQTIMSIFVLRRKKDSMLDGKRLIELPEKEVKLVKLEFSEEEREIYNMVEAKNQAIFNRFLRAGTVLKNYHQVLVLLLRLRQICSHPSLIQEDGKAFVHPDEARDDFKPKFATELTRARRLVSDEFVAKMKAKFLKQALDRLSAEKASANATVEDDECPICYDAMTDAVLTPCGHEFCRECIVDYLNTRPPAEAGEGPTCPCCRLDIEADKLFSRSAFEPSDRELKSGSSIDSDVEMEDVEEMSACDRKGKGKATNQREKPTKHRKAQVESDDESDNMDYSGSDEDDDDISDFIVESDEDEEEKDARRAIKKRLGKKRVNIIIDSDDELDTPEEKEVLFGVRKNTHVSPEVIKLMPRFLPSSKMKYMMDQLQQLLKTNPEEKTLVVSQWTSCLSLVSDYLEEKGIPHVKYQGDMNRNKRDQAVKVFMSKEKARVMLMSLKCGGVGLNLTRANNVISLDLGWSQAVESQAFDRVHRLGQKRKVLVQRVVVADTVEDRILKLQERKQTIADGSLGEGTAKRIGKLSVKELANLFGLDARGHRL